MESIIQSYLEQSRYVNLNTVDGSKGLCDGVSYDLCKYLKELNISCEVIEGIGYKPELHYSAHTDWQNFKGKYQKFLAHVVVKVCDLIIDLTGAQFNCNNGSRLIYPYDIFKQEWTQIKTLPKRN